MRGFLSGTVDTLRTVWSVGELTRYIRELFELDYRLQDVEVSGEISNFTQARSGHLYFTLKDANAQLKCVMWRSTAGLLRFRPGEGDAVVARGRVTVYEAGGAYQLYVERLDPAGRGDLATAFERLKEELAAEGLFDPAYKQPIPSFPHKVGIVTSPDAAALRDILNVLRRRNPLVSVLIAPSLVQGEQAPPQIVRALRWLDGREDVDTILIARGGGSIEDLWAFNDARVARAVFAAQHPIISGVGHETDFTIVDFVADLRAPTPSAAAELAVPDLSDIRPYLKTLERRLLDDIAAIVSARQRQLQGQRQLLALLSPRSRLDHYGQWMDGLTGRLDRAMIRLLERKDNRLALVSNRLDAVSPFATLARGYAIVRHQDGRVVRTIHDVESGDQLTIRVGDGEFGAKVIS
jgi:exodeoxyribonuclease VII large subunit